MFVTDHLDVVVGEGIDVRDGWVELEGWQWEWRSADLQLGLIEVIVVEVGITKGVDEGARFEPAYLGHHVCQQGIGCNVERDTEKHISTALIELTIQPPLGDMELKEGVAGHQRHFVKFADIPCRYDDSTAVGIGFDRFNRLLHLVDDTSIFGFPTAPLFSINGTQIPVFIGPFVPYSDTVFLEILDVCIALEKPKQFMNDGGQVKFLGGHHRKTFGEVEAHLVAKDRCRPSSSSVTFVSAVGQDVPHQLKVCFQGSTFRKTPKEALRRCSLTTPTVI